MKTALLVLVHGTPRPAANSDMLRVVDVVRERGLYEHVEVGYLDCNEPNIPEAIARCAKLGAERIIAVPYFLHAGTHVAEDLPKLIHQGRLNFPTIQFELGRYIGSSPHLTIAMEARAIAASNASPLAS